MCMYVFTFLDLQKLIYYIKVCKYVNAFCYLLPNCFPDRLPFNTAIVSVDMGFLVYTSTSIEHYNFNFFKLNYWVKSVPPFHFSVR